MSAALLWTVFLPPALFIFWTLWNLANNYLKARKVGLPVIIVPISPENLVWMQLARYFLPILKYVPFGNGYFSRFCHIGWEFDEKTRAHLELGDAFMFATPTNNWIYLCNAATAHDIIKRERQGEFERPAELMAMLDAFGPNLATVCISFLC